MRNSPSFEQGISEIEQVCHYFADQTALVRLIVVAIGFLLIVPIYSKGQGALDLSGFSYLGKPNGGIAFHGDSVGYALFPIFPKKVDFHVSNLTDFLDALRWSKAGSVISINDTAIIYLGQSVTIPSYVSVISDRGVNKNKGALIVTGGRSNCMIILENGARIYGVRIRGENTMQKSGEAQNEPTIGIYGRLGKVYVENCELFNYIKAAIYLSNGIDSAVISYNYIHDCLGPGLGYAICLDRCDALIAGNVFDNNRHAVAATGAIGTGYAVVSNLFLYHSVPYEQYIDMHGGRDRNDGTNVAGDYVDIFNNTFYLDSAKQSPPVVIRGAPIFGGAVYNNRIILLRFLDKTGKKFVIPRLLAPSKNLLARHPELSNYFQFSDSMVNEVSTRGYFRQYYVPFNLKVHNNSITKLVIKGGL